MKIFNSENQWNTKFRSVGNVDDSFSRFVASLRWDRPISIGRYYYVGITLSLSLPLSLSLCHGYKITAAARVSGINRAREGKTFGRPGYRKEIKTAVSGLATIPFLHCAPSSPRSHSREHKSYPKASRPDFCASLFR